MELDEDEVLCFWCCCCYDDNTYCEIDCWFCEVGSLIFLLELFFLIELVWFYLRVLLLPLVLLSSSNELSIQENSLTCINTMVVLAIKFLAPWYCIVFLITLFFHHCIVVIIYIDIIAINHSLRADCRLF